MFPYANNGPTMFSTGLENQNIFFRNIPPTVQIFSFATIQLEAQPQHDMLVEVNSDDQLIKMGHIADRRRTISDMFDL